jgi:hypothetical protein
LILVLIVAFCFYNLSSILNGLVYYDQFAALSVTHLLLVVLGISVLLGGVWAVSMQSGGPRLEVGTWQEGAEVLTAEALNIPNTVTSPVAVSPSPQKSDEHKVALECTPRSGTYRRADAAGRLGRSTPATTARAGADAHVLPLVTLTLDLAHPTRPPPSPTRRRRR